MTATLNGTLNGTSVADTRTTTWADVERAQAGDVEAFDRIYREHFDTVRKFISWRIRHEMTTEDLTSDVFVRAWKSIGSVVWQGKPIQAWLMTIARNIVNDHYGSSRVQREIISGAIYDVNDGRVVEPVDHDSPEELVVTHTGNVELLALVTKLSPDQREVMVLRFIRGLTIGETARIMGRNVGAVKALQFRAVQNLRDRVGRPA
jgi:RNA polymerase sigma-70 factor (ECF subfamily)